MRDSFVFAAKTGELGENENRAYELNGVSVLVCKTADGIFAVENRCTHQLQPLEGGRMRGCFIFCPLHGQRFDLKDGAPIGTLTKKPVRVFPVRVENDDIYVDMGA